MGYGLPRGILSCLPRPTLIVHDHLANTLASLLPKAKVIDVGAGGRRVCPGVITFDTAGADICGDIHAMPIPDASYDCVVCTGTLEHVVDPWKAVAEIRRILKPGGIVHIDVPWKQGFHADPDDFWRFSLHGLRLLCRDFEHLDSGVHIGPSCALTWIAREWADSTSSNRVISNLALATMAFAIWPLKFCDYFMQNGKSHRAASAVWFRGIKRLR